MLQFSKYQGLGNDFLLMDGRQASQADSEAGLAPELVRQLCDRRFGVGGDGVILALPSQAGGELRMRIFNADGSEPEMCGNGIRCLARFLADRDGDGPGRRWQVDTLAGRIVPELLDDGSIRVDMGPPFLEPATVPTTAAGMGNPHVVVAVEDLADFDLERFGPLLEVHPSFPAKTNVHFVQVLAPDHLVMRVWERGAGPTLACGTGACATLVACHCLGLVERRARVDLPGGPLQIHWDADTGHVIMDGPAEHVFDGAIPSAEAVQEARRQAAGAGQEPPDPSPDFAPEAPFGVAPERAPAQAPGLAPPEPAPAAETIQCAVVCVHGCIRPEACPNAEARAKVAALLAGSSLDDLVAIASSSLESRIRSRISGPGDAG